MTYNEILLIAKDAKTADELIALAKDNGIGATEEEIRNYFEQTHKTGEIEDDELLKRKEENIIIKITPTNLERKFL